MDGDDHEDDGEHDELLLATLLLLLLLLLLLPEARSIDALESSWLVEAPPLAPAVAL